MKRGFILGTLLLGGLLALLASGGATPAYATGGPHGEYTASTDNCAGCHRSHTALGTKLLKDAAAATGQRALNLCKFCHNGSGSALDVLDGVRIDLTGNGGYTVPTADSATQLTVSVESATVVGPTAKSLTTVPANSTTYTIKVKNKSGAAITGTIARSQTNVTATQFATSTLTPDATFTALAAGASEYTTLTVIAGTAPTAGSVSVDTVTATVTAGGENAAVKVNTRIGSWLLLGGGFQYQNGVAVTSTHFNAVAGTEQTANDSKKPWGYAGTDATRSSYATGGTPADADPGQAGRRPSGAVLLANMLECTSCHNPHGGSNYRMLNNLINTYPVNVKAWDNSATEYNEGVGASETLRRGLDGATGGAASKYTDSYERYYSGGANSLGVTISDAQANMTSFCSACHTAYASDVASTGLTAQSVTTYRHTTEKAVTGRPGCATGTCDDTTNPEDGASRLYSTPILRLASKDSTTFSNEYSSCLTCHRAHGTTTAMSGSYSQSAAVATGGGVTAGKSSLLFLDNRGVCQVCHQW